MAGNITGTISVSPRITGVLTVGPRITGVLAVGPRITGVLSEGYLPPPVSYVPSFRFNDKRNSQYIFLPQLFRW